MMTAVLGPLGYTISSVSARCKGAPPSGLVDREESDISVVECGSTFWAFEVASMIAISGEAGRSAVGKERRWRR